VRPPVADRRLLQTLFQTYRRINSPPGSSCAGRAGYGRPAAATIPWLGQRSPPSPRLPPPVRSRPRSRRLPQHQDLALGSAARRVPGAGQGDNRRSRLCRAPSCPASLLVARQMVGADAHLHDAWPVDAGHAHVLGHLQPDTQKRRPVWFLIFRFRAAQGTSFGAPWFHQRYDPAPQ
jgi:hypothetical protein